MPRAISPSVTPAVIGEHADQLRAQRGPNFHQTGKHPLTIFGTWRALNQTASRRERPGGFPDHPIALVSRKYVIEQALRTTDSVAIG